MNWSNVTVGQFQELSELKAEDCKDIDEFILIRLSILFNRSPEEISELFEEDFNELIGQINFIGSPIPQRSQASLKINEELTLFKIQDFNSLTIGEYIDLEHFFETDYIKNLTTILSIVYRQKIIKNSVLFPDELEKYGDWIFHRKDLFNNIRITEVYGVINDYIKFRAELMESYTGLFEEAIKEDTDQEPEIDEKESIRERAERRKEEQLEKTRQKWSWYYWLYKLAKENNISLQEASTIPLIEAFNTMAMKKELNLE